MATSAWADWTEEAASQDEAEEMLRWAEIMRSGMKAGNAAGCQDADHHDAEKEPNQEDQPKTKKPKWIRKRPLPTGKGQDDDYMAGALDAAVSATEAPSPASFLCGPSSTGAAHGGKGPLQSDAPDVSRPNSSGLQAEALQSQLSTTGPPQFSGWLLNLEVCSYVCAVMQPDSHLRWGRLSMWQRDLQQRSNGWDFPCPFWHAVVYDLDLGLLVEVEAFARLLLTDAWDLELMGLWQRRLRALTRRLWFPQRLWYDLIHRLNLRGGEQQVRSSLANLLASSTDRGCKGR